MFIHNTPNTGNGTQLSAKRTITKVGVIVTAAALGTTLAIGFPASAAADSNSTAYAQGRLLSGSVAGANLDGVAALRPATASNNGSQPTQVSSNPLSATVLNTATINVPDGIHPHVGDYVDVGAVSQYAKAQSNGTSMAASGVLGNNGAADTGPASGSPVGSGAVTLDLTNLLGANLASVLTNVSLQAQGIAAQANANGSTASGGYTLNGLKLNFTSPAIANLGNKVDAALAPVESRIGALDGPTGQLTHTVNGAVLRISPALNLLGVHARVTATINAHLRTALAPLLNGTYGNGAVTVDFRTGAVSVDLAKLEGGGLNNEPVGTEVLSAPVVNKILDSITATVSTLGDQVLDKAKAALVNASVRVHATVNTSTLRTPILGQTCTNSAGVLGGLLGSVGQLICSTTKTSLPSLNTLLDVNVAGTVGQLTSGDPARATASLTLLGVPVKVNVDAIVGGIGTDLTNQLLDSNSAVTDLTTGVTKGVVEPTVDGLLADNGTSVNGVLSNVLSVTLNNQDLSKQNGGNLFTENALRVTALPAAGTDGLATVDLASATVGPNITSVVPGNPTSPGSPGNPGNPTLPGSPVSPSAFSNLAYTGVGIATLVAMILALLAAGAYLVREGYRRNSRRQIS